MLKQLFAATALACALVASPAVNAAGPGEHPSFLRAAIFFLDGVEPGKDARMDGDNHAYEWADEADYREGKPPVFEFTVKKEEPCVVYAKLDWQDLSRGISKTNLIRYDFTKFPSPRVGRFWSQVVLYDVPQEAMCSLKVNKCNSSIQFDQRSWPRRATALDYIRANYCKGLPEPPPPPRQAY